MKIVNNRAIILKTKRPHMVTEKVKNYRILEEQGGVYKLAIRWDLEGAQALTDLKVKNVPSPNSLSALMSKNPQVVIVGKQKVEMTVGINTQHMLFDIDREVIKTKDDLILTRPISVMTPSERSKAKQCPVCAKTRIMPTDENHCIACIRRA